MGQVRKSERPLPVNGHPASFLCFSDENGRADMGRRGGRLALTTADLVTIAGTGSTCIEDAAISKPASRFFLRNWRRAPSDMPGHALSIDERLGARENLDMLGILQWKAKYR